MKGYWECSVCKQLILYSEIHNCLSKYNSNIIGGNDIKNVDIFVEKYTRKPLIRKEFCPECECDQDCLIILEDNIHVEYNCLKCGTQTEKYFPRNDSIFS